MSSPPVAGPGPLVVACLRLTDLRPRVDPLTGAIARERWGIGWPAPEAAALEYAFRAAEAWQGRVLALTAGEAVVDPVLAEARALGASVLRIPLDEMADRPYAEELAADEHELARLVAAALAPVGPPALVLCGDRSSDRGTGALPGFLAHELGAAQALGLVRLEVAPEGGGSPGEDRGLVAERRLDGGWRERLRVPLPAVCSVEPAGIALRRASLAAALSSERVPVPVAWPGRGWGAAEGRALHVGPPRPFRPRTRVLPAPAGAEPRARMVTLTGALVAHDPPTVVGPVDAPGAADALFDFLVRHRYLDSAPAPDRHGDGTR